MCTLCVYLKCYVYVHNYYMQLASIMGVIYKKYWNIEWYKFLTFNSEQKYLWKSCLCILQI